MNTVAQSPFRREIADFLQLLTTLPGVQYVEDTELVQFGSVGGET